jgi:hypothetical protein
VSELEDGIPEPTREEIEKHIHAEAEKSLQTMVRHALIRLTPDQVIEVVTKEARLRG